MPSVETRALLAVACLLAGAAPAAAQSDTVRAGGPGHDAFELPLGTDSSDTYAVRNGERRLVMTYVETISAVPEGYLIVGRNVRPDGATVTLDSVVVAGGSLAPVRHSDVTPAGRTAVTFAGGRMTGVATDTAGRETPLDAAVSPGAFDYSISGLVLRQLPLAEEYERVLLTHDIKRGTVPIGIRVLARERVPHAGGGREAWKVEIDYGPFQAMRWLDVESRRDLRTTVSVNGNELIVEPR